MASPSSIPAIPAEKKRPIAAIMLDQEGKDAALELDRLLSDEAYRDRLVEAEKKQEIVVPSLEDERLGALEEVAYQYDVELSYTEGSLGIDPTLGTMAAVLETFESALETARDDERTRDAVSALFSDHTFEASEIIGDLAPVVEEAWCLDHPLTSVPEVTTVADEMLFHQPGERVMGILRGKDSWHSATVRSGTGAYDLVFDIGSVETGVEAARVRKLDDEGPTPKKKTPVYDKHPVSSKMRFSEEFLSGDSDYGDPGLPSPPPRGVEQSGFGCCSTWGPENPPSARRPSQAIITPMRQHTQPLPLSPPLLPQSPPPSLPPSLDPSPVVVDTRQVSPVPKQAEVKTLKKTPPPRKKRLSFMRFFRSSPSPSS